MCEVHSGCKRARILADNRDLEHIRANLLCFILLSFHLVSLMEHGNGKAGSLSITPTVMVGVEKAPKSVIYSVQLISVTF